MFTVYKKMYADDTKLISSVSIEADRAKLQADIGEYIQMDQNIKCVKKCKVTHVKAAN